jgi:hypothetical protein
MQEGIASSLAAMGIPSAFVAHGRSDRADTSALSISESVDRADAPISRRTFACRPIRPSIGPALNPCCTISR